MIECLACVLIVYSLIYLFFKGFICPWGEAWHLVHTILETPRRDSNFTTRQLAWEIFPYMFAIPIYVICLLYCSARNVIKVCGRGLSLMGAVPHGRTSEEKGVGWGEPSGRAESLENRLFGSAGRLAPPVRRKPE